jgi:hypothetical protein
MGRLSRRGLLAGLVAAISCRPSWANVLVTPAGQFFSAEFPNQPSERSAMLAQTALTMYSAREADTAFSVAHALVPMDGNPIVLMQSILDGLVERTSSELLSVDKSELLSASRKKLPAKRFTFGSARIWGGGLAVVSGHHAFLVQVTKRRPSEGFDAVDRKFMASFKVLD